MGEMPAHFSEVVDEVELKRQQPRRERRVDPHFDRLQRVASEKEVVLGEDARLLRALPEPLGCA